MKKANLRLEKTLERQRFVRVPTHSGESCILQVSQGNKLQVKVILFPLTLITLSVFIQ